MDLPWTLVSCACSIKENAQLAMVDIYWLVYHRVPGVVCGQSVCVFTQAAHNCLYRRGNQFLVSPS